MKKIRIISVIVGVVICSFNLGKPQSGYHKHYLEAISAFGASQDALINTIKNTDCSSESGRGVVRDEISRARLQMKGAEIWLRYLEPVAYNKINGPLPVEWENEVFEKFEKPYKREGSGLSLAELYLDVPNMNKDSLLHLVQLSSDALKTFMADSITGQLDTFDHFWFANRLYLLNLAAVYTTSFECPSTKNIIPELRAMLIDVKSIYASYNQSFPAMPLTKDYLALYDKAITFVNNQPSDHTQFDHFTFIKDYVNPLFAINQKLITTYGAISKSNNDYTLNNEPLSIFDKTLYTPQNTKGVYSLVEDKETLEEIKHIGKLLFYDPILSGNNQRSCVSCHKPTQYLTDTSAVTSMTFDKSGRLPRNTPSLINVVFNHLLMLDGRHISLQSQARDVMTNPNEMGSDEKDILEKVLSCKEYKTAFKKFLKLTPEENKITLDHVVSALTYYYSDYSTYYSPFDEAMNSNKPLSAESARGFNLFMGKARCATCHFVPQFNGVKPPYVSSEFEVIGVPEDTTYHKISEDKGRYVANPAFETMHAFRTGSIRNAEFTKPYMHNGVFHSLEEVVDFYDAGGGLGKKLNIDNQTLSQDSLKLTAVEKKELISFIKSLNEKVIFQKAPETLPVSANAALNARKVGGEY